MSSGFEKVFIRTAKFEYVCCKCGKPILPGDKYRVTEGHTGREFFREKECSIFNMPKKKSIEDRRYS